MKLKKICGVAIMLMAGILYSIPTQPVQAAQINANNEVTVLADNSGNLDSNIPGKKSIELATVSTSGDIKFNVTSCGGTVTIVLKTVSGNYVNSQTVTGKTSFSLSTKDNKTVKICLSNSESYQVVIAGTYSYNS